MVGSCSRTAGAERRGGGAAVHVAAEPRGQIRELGQVGPCEAPDGLLGQTAGLDLEPRELSMCESLAELNVRATQPQTSEVLCLGKPRAHVAVIDPRVLLLLAIEVTDEHALESRCAIPSASALCARASPPALKSNSPTVSSRRCSLAGDFMSASNTSAVSGPFESGRACRRSHARCSRTPKSGARSCRSAWPSSTRAAAQK